MKTLVAMFLLVLAFAIAAATARHLLGNTIELGGGHSRRNARAQLGQHLRHDDVGSAHDLDLVAPRVDDGGGHRHQLPLAETAEQVQLGGELVVGREVASEIGRLLERKAIAPGRDVVIYGQDEVIGLALTAILGGGHALLVGAPQQFFVTAKVGF